MNKEPICEYCGVIMVPHEPFYLVYHEPHRRNYVMCQECKKIRDEDPCECRSEDIPTSNEEDVSCQSHYVGYGVEPLQVMKDKMSFEEFEGFLWGNIIKYILRWKFKDGVKDLRKASKYLQWLIEHEEQE